MTQHPDFLAALAANPDDDTTRLVFADWLDEQDKPDLACDQRLHVLMRQLVQVGDELAKIRVDMKGCQYCSCDSRDLMVGGVRCLCEYCILCCDERMFATSDAALRLKYAATCKAYGRRERAEFICVQCELAKPCQLGYSDAYHVDAVCAACDPLSRCEQVLLDGRGWGWAGKAIRDAVVLGTDYKDVLVYRGGFVETIAISAVDWLQHADAICKATPLRKVTLTTWPSVYARGDNPPFTIRPQGNGWYQVIAAQNIVEECLAAEWPAIEFTLPALALFGESVLRAVYPAFTAGEAIRRARR